MKEVGEGLFFGKYEIRLEKYTGNDFSKKVFMFPGQGSAFPGMYKQLYNESHVIRQRFAVADKMSKELGLPDISSYIKEEKLSKEQAAQIRNLALFTLEIGLFELLLTKNIIPAILTAHSFGEYAALTAAGVVGFKDMFTIIAERDRLANLLAPKGGLWAARESSETLESMLPSELFYISNINSPNQTVIAARLEKQKEIESFFKNKKIPVVRLDVPQAYHSPIMQSTHDEFSKFVSNQSISIKAPSIPILSSTSLEIIDAKNFSEDIVRKIICQQIITPVRFRQQIEKLSSQGLINFIEIGPQKILSGFVKDTLAKSVFKARTIDDFSQTENTGNKKSAVDSDKKISSKLSQIFNKALSSVTGYEVESIKLRDRLQEDLGIDSIKKAEIVFKVLEDLGVDNASQGQSIVLSELSTVDDILNYFDREQRTSGFDDKMQDGKIDKTFKTWTSQWAENKITPFQKSLLRSIHLLTVRFDSIESLEKIKKDIIEFYKKSDDSIKLVQFVFAPNFELSQEFLKSNSQRLDKWYVDFAVAWSDLKIDRPWCDQNSHFHFIFDQEHRHLGLTLRSFMKSWTLEQGALTGKTIEICGQLDNKNLENLKYEVVDPYYSFIRYDERGCRYTQALKVEPVTKKYEQKKNAVYLIIGGHRGIGWELTQSIDAKLNPKVYILGRAPDDEQNVKRTTEFLNHQKIENRYFSCDARDTKKFNEAIDQICQMHGKIDFVYNSVGIAVSKILHLMTSEQIAAEISTKVVTVTNLALAYAAGKINHVISFSSVAGHYGTAGQSAYALGNSFIDALANIYDHQGDKRFQSILWGAWKSTGITSSELVQSYIDVVGLTYLEPKLGVEFAWNTAANKASAVTVIDENSNLRYQVGAADKKSFRQFFSSIQSPYLGKTLDVQGLTLNNLPFLRDHRLTGQPILAASNMIALFAQFGFVLWGQIPEVKKFIGHNFIIIPENESQIFLDIERSEQSVLLKMRSNFIHSEGEIIKPVIKKVRKMDMPRYKDQLDNDLLLNSIIETGETFDFESVLWANSDLKDVVVEFKVADLPVCTEMPLFDRLYQLIEISHQSLGLTSQWRTGRYSIPKSIDHFELFEETEVTEKLYSVHGPLKHDDKNIFGDTFILNERQEVVIALHGVKFAFLPKDAQVNDRFKFLRKTGK